MSSFRLSLAAVAAFAILAVPAAAAPKPKPQPPNGAQGASALSIAATPNPTVFSSSTVLSGRLTGTNVAGVRITLESNRYPYPGFKVLGAGTTTDSKGNYSFTLTPSAATKYRVTAKTQPPVTSAELLVRVRMRVSTSVSDRTPRVGQLVRFSGNVTPAHDGRLVSIQRRSSTGRFVTVARARLRDTGTIRSSYNRSIRVNRSGVYRVLAPADVDHLRGIGTSRTLTVG